MHITVPEAHALRALTMRTTLNIDDQLFEEAAGLSGVKERTALIRESLKAQVERESTSCSCRYLCLEKSFSTRIQPVKPFS
jgi:Arc/MetJ family transcription regulator